MPVHPTVALPAAPTGALTGAPTVARRLAGPYAALPPISGASFLPVSFFGRLPVTMAPLAILTFAAAVTGSYATAGLAATATALGTAVGAPLAGRLADRYGQRPVLSVVVLANAATLAAMALAPTPGRVALLAACGLAGLTLPQVGGMARARWLALTRRHAGTAMAWEGTADEVAFVLGPAAAGLVASLFGARAALLVAAVAGLAAAGAFALHPTHRATRGATAARPTGTDRTAAGGTTGRVLAPVLVPVVAMALMGVYFAAVQSALTVFAAGTGRPAAGGLVYALMAVGSAGTALATAALPHSIGPRARCAVAAAGLLGGTALMAAAGGLGPLCAAVLAAGLPVGPMLVTLNQVAGAAAPPGRAATTMAYLSAGTVVGIAAGASAAGALAEATGSRGAFAVAAGAAVALLALSLLGLRPRGPRR